MTVFLHFPTTNKSCIKSHFFDIEELNSRHYIIPRVPTNRPQQYIVAKPLGTSKYGARFLN